MIERRRGERSVFSQPGMATLRVTQDVEITHLDTTEAAVFIAHTTPVGERMLLEIRDTRGAVSAARLVRTTATRFAFKDGRLLRELYLSVLGHTGFTGGQPSISSIPPAVTPMVGNVSRRVPVQLVEVSVSGCLCDAAAPLDEGVVGFLDVRTRGQLRTEAVRILRAVRAVGSPWPFRMAVEFLTLAPSSPDSLRGVAAVVATGTPRTSQLSVAESRRF
jgi:hypothetical protein